MELLIQKFCLEHESWEEILKAKPYRLKIRRDNGYVLFTYTLGETDFNIPLCRECRGVILDETNKFKPMCVPFYKFFNFGEPEAAKINWKSAMVEEKIDGSLIKLWYDRDGKLVFSTNGNIYADKTICENMYTKNDITFGQLAADAFKRSARDLTINMIDKNATHMFELTSRYNKIIVDYGGTPTLTYLGSRDLETGKEYNSLIFMNYFKTPKLYRLKSLEEVKEACARMNGFTEEGFVVVDKDYNRIKVKSPEYVKIAHTLTKVNSFKGIIKVLKDDDIDEILSYCTFEESQGIEKVRYNLTLMSYDIGDIYYETKWQAEDDRKEFARIVNEKYRWCAPVLFRLYGKNEIVGSHRTVYDILLNSLTYNQLNSVYDYYVKNELGSY